MPNMKFLKRIILKTTILSALIFAQSVFSQTRPVEGLHENAPNVVALTNVTVVVAPGNVVEGATVVIRDSYIDAVGKNVKVPADAVVRDLSGKTVYPAFIDLYTHYGIAAPKPSRSGGGGGGFPFGAPSAPAASNDDGAVHWNKNVRPEQRVADMFKHDDKAAGSLRKSGFATVMSFPRSGIFRGQGALILLKDGDKNETILADQPALGMAMSKGGAIAFSFDVSNYPGSVMGVMALMRQTLHDAEWYQKSWAAYNASPAGKTAPEKNLSFAALLPYAKDQKLVVFEAANELEILRASRIAKEFGLNAIVRGGGSEYRRLNAIKSTGLKLVVPLNFPEAPKVATLEDEFDVSLRDLRHWDLAPENAGRVAKADVLFSLTSSTLKKTEDFLGNLRKAVKRGLSKDRALAALTSTPAAWLGMSNTLGGVESGKLANLVVTNGDLFDDATKIYETWVSGKRYEITPSAEIDPRGTWTITLAGSDTGIVTFGGTDLKPSASKVRVQGKEIKGAKATFNGRQMTMSFAGDSLNKKGTVRLSGLLEDQEIKGTGVWPDGARFKWSGTFAKAHEENKKGDEKAKDSQMSSLQIVYPEGAYGITSTPEQPAVVLVKNATIWTSGPEGKLENADMLVRDGKISKVGQNLPAPGNAVEIDASGKHVTPGLIDAHSHTASSDPFVNELTYSITSEVRMGDVINPDDIDIYRQLAGGTTSVLQLHGSGNSIGGQSITLKFRWGAGPEEMKFEGAAPTIKFALGENVKRASIPNDNRFPKTRMGVEQFFTSWFDAAKDYQREIATFKNAKKNAGLIPPRRDLRLDALVEIMNDERIIHCHSYRQDEILALMRVAERTGFKVFAFTHILEGYKVADEMVKHGAMASTFSDWWVYKFEVYDAIPYGGALMHDQGLVVSFNSDSGELARRLNTEASKAVKYGAVPEEEALKFVTINPAKQLRVEDRVGSLEEGKDADFVIWSGNPLSTYSICEQTWIDGRKYFDLETDAMLQEKAAKERAQLVQKVLAQGGSGNKSGRPAGGR